MPIVEFSERDLKRGTTVEPSWYRVHIEEIDADGEASKDQKSINYKAEGTILFDGDTGDTKYAGVPVVWNFNSKAMGFTKGLFDACGLDIQAKTRYRLEACGGRDIDMFIGNKIFNGRTINDFNHMYRRLKPDVTPYEPPAGQPEAEPVQS